MWFKIFNSKLFQILISVAGSFLLLILTQRFATGREYAKSIKEEFDKRPTTEEVNLKFSEVKSYIDKQDENLINYINQHIIESNKTDQTLMNYIKSMDGKIDILLESKNER